MTDRSFAEFSAWCREELARARVPSISVAVGRSNAVIFADAFGWADVSSSRKATAETPYLLASITKPITATAVCLLAEWGLLDLDEPVERYLSGARFTVTGGQRTPTVRHLLQHTSGLWTQYEFLYADSDRGRRPFQQSMERYGILFADPGSTYVYANFGYGILDEVIRSVTSGEPEEFVREHVFAPLGMNSACIGPDYLGEAEPATRYALRGWAYPSYDMCHRGASAGWMTASDLVRFGFTQTGGPSVVSPEMRGRMLHTVRVNDGVAYGLGWQVGERRYQTVGHSGSMPGVSTLLTTVPSEQLVVAVLCNASGPSSHETARLLEVQRPLLTERVRDRLLQTFLADYETSEASIPSPNSEPERFASGSYRGVIHAFERDIPLALDVTEDGLMSVSIGSGDPVAGEVADPLVNSTFRPDLHLRAPIQLPTEDAMVRSSSLELILIREGQGLAGVAAAIPTPEGDEDGARLGNYYNHWCELS